MQDISLVFWYILIYIAINKLLENLANVFTVMGVIAAQVKHECAGKLDAIIMATHDYWRYSGL